MGSSAIPLGTPKMPTLNANPSGANGTNIPGATVNANPAGIMANPAAGQPLGAAGNNPMIPITAMPLAQGTAAPVAAGVSSIPTAQTNNINWSDGSKTVTGDFKDTYGAGTGTAITNVLQGLGTSTDSAVQATLNNINQQAGKQFANIQAGEAASGVTANSSTAALASGDFWSGVNASEQQTISGMELNEEQTLLQTLLGEGEKHGTDASTLDNVMNGITDWTTITGDLGKSVASIAGV